MKDESKRTELEVNYMLTKYLDMSIESIDKLDEKTKHAMVDTLKGLSDEWVKELKFPVPYEPKRNNRWMARFPEKLGIQEWWQAETSRPVMNITPSGDVFYQPITFKLRDAIGPSTSQALNRMMIGMTEHNGSSHETSLKKLFEEERKKGFDYELELLDPSGVVIESWTIMGCKLVNIDYGRLNMADDGICEVTMVLQPKTFVLNY